MAKTPTPDEAIERARRAQEDRIDAIRVLAEARQSVTDVRDETARELAELQAKIAERVGAAERDDVKTYNAALAAGWSVDELRKIGFPEPEKKARVRRRQTRAAAPAREASSESTAPTDSDDVAAPATGDAAA
ncbi:hypothetical protein [Xylanimonas allomyrinae]|uniref:hypothetical protein n=1 Tax=Xylanimonas allomyrinae TaxID=2509459 RepID=UPI001FED01C5|nr:hypothetical protein [Xylanimonas allomyrinae]